MVENTSEVRLSDDCGKQIVDRIGDLRSLFLTSKQFQRVSNHLVTRLRISKALMVGISPPKLLRRFHRVKEIEISYFQNEREFHKLILCIARSGLDLEELQVANRCRADGIQELGSNMKNLRTFKRNSYPDLTARESIFIANCFPSLEEFEGWRLTCDSVSGPRCNTHSKALADKLKGLRKLHLSLIDAETSDSDFTTLVENCVSINELKVNVPGAIKGRGIGDSISAVEKSLTAIDFNNMAISEALLRSIATADIQLKKLSLHHCWGFTYEGLSSLLQKQHQFLTHFKLVRDKFLNYRRLDDVSAYLHNLTSLEICVDPKVTDSAVFNLI